MFGGAFLMRPIGGILMGYLGDLYGRKKALEISIFLMAFPTFCMGCLPTYAQVGPISYILLIIIRLLQGLSVGGQLMSSLVFTLEGRPKSKWGLLGSYVMATANFGTLMGGVVGYAIRQKLTAEQVMTYGWRIPFLSGILVSLCGFYLKYCCSDDDADSFHHGGGGRERSSNVTKTKTQRKQRNNPIFLAFSKDNRRQLLAACFPSMLWSGGFYLTFVWMAIYMLDLIPNSMGEDAMAINSIALFLSVCLLFPIAGGLSDTYGRKRVMTIGAVLFGLLSPILVVLIGLGKPYVAFLCQVIMGICLSFWGAPMTAYMIESFPPEARLTSAAVGYNIGQACVGGLTPGLATYMVDQYGYRTPGLLLTGLAIVALFGLWVVGPQQFPVGYSEDKSVECKPLITIKRGEDHEDYETETHAATNVTGEYYRSSSV